MKRPKINPLYILIAGILLLPIGVLSQSPLVLMGYLCGIPWIAFYAGCEVMRARLQRPTASAEESAA